MHTLRRGPRVDVQEGHAGFAVTVPCGVIALFVEVVSESVVPLSIAIVREVVNALVLELEWELVRRVVSQGSFRGWLVVGHRNLASICLHFFGSPVGWSHHGGGVGAIIAFEELSLQRIDVALILERLQTVLERAVEEVPRRVVLLRSFILVLACEARHSKQILRRVIVDEELDGEGGKEALRLGRQQLRL